MNKNDIREGELELINKHTRTPLTENDVYAFSVILCDNDIDRDFERFSDNRNPRKISLHLLKAVLKKKSVSAVL